MQSYPKHEIKSASESLNHWLNRFILMADSLTNQVSVSMNESLNWFIQNCGFIQYWITAVCWSETQWFYCGFDWNDFHLQNAAKTNNLKYIPILTCLLNCCINQSHISSWADIGEKQHSCWCDIAKLYHKRVIFFALISWILGSYNCILIGFIMQSVVLHQQLYQCKMMDSSGLGVR